MNHKLVCARAARHEFGGAFRRGIADFRGARLAAATLARHLSEKLTDELSLLPLAHVYDGELVQLAWEGSVEQANAGAQLLDRPIQIMARKRPLQPEEAQAGEYDSLSFEGANNSVVVHDGRVHRDGRTLYMVHSRFCCDRVFNETADNDTVYRQAVAPLLERVLSGGRATTILFGQTGTGKTHTARGVLDRLAAQIFDGAAGVPSVSVQCYELAATRGGRDACFDLLSEHAQVKCLTGEDGQVHVRGARSVSCASPEELLRALRAAFEWRSSEQTERNEASSRSHAIIELQLPPAAAGAGAPGPEGLGGGVLRIVDLAGSERNYETRNHTRMMAERGGGINYSLLMLKECARIMHHNERVSREGQGEKQHVPFRSSRLTHLLKSCFTDDAHRTVVVATLSPSPTDIEHSLNSLQHVGMMSSGRGEAGEDAAGPSRASACRGGKSGGGGFQGIEGRGHGLHSKLQDERKSQMKLHAFNMVTLVGGTIQKKYDAASLKTEAFIDPRWHREMNVRVDEKDLWVLKEADAEVIQLLTAWREEQWEAGKVHDITRWGAASVRSFVQSLELPGSARIPSTMTGAQLLRLGRRGIFALCSDEATAEVLYAAIQGERAANTESATSACDRNAKMTALGNHKVHAATLFGRVQTSAPQPSPDTRQGLQMSA